VFENNVLKKVPGPRMDDVRQKYRVHSKVRRDVYMAPTVGNEEQEASMGFKCKDEKTRNAYRLSVSNRTRRR
jgi:hypothetical protein